MDTAMPETMKAAAIDRFGGPEVFGVRSLSVPKPKPNQVLIRLDGFCATARFERFVSPLQPGRVPSGS
jgi:hypothetical protein